MIRDIGRNLLFYSSNILDGNSKIKCSWEHFVIIKHFDSIRLTWNENLKYSHFVIIENDIWNTDSSLMFYEVIKLLLLTKFSDMIYKY